MRDFNYNSFNTINVFTSDALIIRFNSSFEFDDDHCRNFFGNNYNHWELMFGFEKIQLTLRNDILYLFEIYVICTTYDALVFLRTHIGHHNELLRYIILFFLSCAHVTHYVYSCSCCCCCCSFFNFVFYLLLWRSWFFVIK